MYDDDGCLGIALGLIAFVAIVGGIMFFEWQAYVQVVDALGVEPNIPAFIGFVLFGN